MGCGLTSEKDMEEPGRIPRQNRFSMREGESSRFDDLNSKHQEQKTAFANLQKEHADLQKKMELMRSESSRFDDPNSKNQEKNDDANNDDVPKTNQVGIQVDYDDLIKREDEIPIVINITPGTLFMIFVS